MKRVWFNHWFSTSYRLIELMRDNRDEEIYIIGSNKQIDSVIKKVCDEWYEDSLTSGQEYVEYCLNFCREHRVDVFVPRRMMVEISENKKRFEEIGVKVLVDDYSKISLLNNKAATYDYFRETKGLYIPDYYIAKTVEQFKEAYSKLRLNNDQICVKFVKDEGGMSYRRIVEDYDRFKRLKIYAGSEITYEAYIEALKEADGFDELMIMPYLPGKEISVDCLQTYGGLIAVPRIKGSARHERIEYREDILTMTKIIMDKINLEYPCNIQFKLKEDIPYLLEINTRMSGGLQMSCLAADVNIPNIALNKLLGNNIDWSMDKREKTVSYIEMPQIINR